MPPSTTCTTSKERGYRTLPMTHVEGIFWTLKDVAHITRKAQVPPMYVRANHLYIYIKSSTKVIIVKNHCGQF